MEALSALFYVDTLSVVMLSLIGFVGVIVAAFSARHLKGDAMQGQFFAGLAVLIGAVFTLVVADHILLFLAAWGVANLALARLIVHKAGWAQARASGMLALKNFGLGFAALVGAFAVLYWQTGLTSIHALTVAAYNPLWLGAALALLVIAAMTQSAIWPFHKWLLSSLNAPTVVSAIMHAGLVNGGGFLIARFSPLFLQMPGTLTVLFALGMATAFLGTAWKLMQSDVKRMLACSTMGQMGFMIVQCGLGLFPAAIAHLCWHGLFKAYLFLGSGSAARERRLDLGYPPPANVFMLALVCGVGAAALFMLAGQKVLVADTTLFLVGLAFISGAQAAIPMLAGNPFKRMFWAAPLTAALGGLYGLSVHGIEQALAPLQLLQPQPLGAVYVLGFAVLALSWVAMLYGRALALPGWLLRVYVTMLNGSQPHVKTVTAHRNQYRYL